MKSISFWIGVLLTAYISLSCINTYGEIDEEWESIWENTDKTQTPKVKIFTPAFDKGRALRWLAQYDLNRLYKFDMATQSDIATQYLKLGEFEKALSIYEPLAKKYPNEYKIIANLGTTYELLGQNKKALKYIQKGFQLNPKSHKDSEWIHVKILEYKVAIGENTVFTENYQILNLDKVFHQRLEKAKKAQPNKNIIEGFIAKKLVDEVDFQLRTRIPFIPPSDKITYQLFKELAVFTGEHLSTSLAYGYALMATYYTYDDSSKEYSRRVAKGFKEQNADNHDAYRLGDLSDYIDTTDFADGTAGVNWFIAGSYSYGIQEVEYRAPKQGYSSFDNEERGNTIPRPLIWVFFILSIVVIAVWLMVKFSPDE